MPPWVLNRYRLFPLPRAFEQRHAGLETGCGDRPAEGTLLLVQQPMHHHAVQHHHDRIRDVRGPTFVDTSFGIFDRLIFVGLYRLFPKACDALAIVKPDTIIRWHRAGFRAYWRWKSRRRGGRPTVPPEIRKLIREMSIANALWGAPRIHGELLKLGIEIGQTSMAKYMARRP